MVGRAFSPGNVFKLHITSGVRGLEILLPVESTCKLTGGSDGGMGEVGWQSKVCISAECLSVSRGHITPSFSYFSLC